ncbi:YgdI/YgdR family lipoprotein [Clostridium estertheticum]|uniref:hypothetical protein n=1 Tax=Clostridium estertheticum TaxID=238834 RepID=UPI0013E95BBF|nr:hypothetical protein [Clostridium estertheticum]MBZ9686307.1 YgdI/YgdR family lipoprotein [Clostridium estertheticum]
MNLNNKKFTILISALTLIFILTACSNSPIKVSTNEGKFSKSNSDTITVDYFIRHKEGFPASLDFELTSGKVDWEITNPKDETVFKGYVLYENGKAYRELTFPLNYMNGNGNLNSKEEVPSLVDKEGYKILNVFNLQFIPSISGKYILKLKPVNAEGSYKVVWSDKFPRK